MQEDTRPFLIKLNDSINEDNHEKVLRYSEQVLIMKSDSDVTRCKLISLINLNKYEQAMQIQKSLDVETSEDAFIKAYLNYKLGKFKDCIDILENKSRDFLTGNYKTKALLAQGHLAQASRHPRSEPPPHRSGMETQIRIADALLQLSGRNPARALALL